VCDEGRSLVYDAKECNAVSTRFYRNPYGTKALRAACFVRLLAKGAPRALHEGPGKRDRAAEGMHSDRDYELTGGVHPAAGSHLPSEGTAQPFAVATRSAGRGTREAGLTRVGDATTALMETGPCIPLRGRIFLRKLLLRPSRSRPEAQGEGPAKRDRPA
jgi:hypothetical protein